MNFPPGTEPRAAISGPVAGRAPTPFRCVAGVEDRGVVRNVGVCEIRLVC
ncbi:hypothetical protein KGY79_02265 [Candidatus Bipolaricaulota bacterium]|nr:hypothetical protein [Candidatus Bipolaricaulota bacterium]